MTANGNKDTIYVDVDDEITTVIDKVRNSPAKVVALVLPKRATVFQSIVNMKLLKRSADSAKKNIVLVTTEAGLLPLAGAVGLHVAPTPQSRPEIPVAAVAVAAAAASDETEGESVAGDDGYNADNAGNRPVGELAGTAAAAQEVETLSLPEDEQPDDAADSSLKKSKKDKRIKVPNFSKFRMRLVLAVLALILLMIGLYYCAVVMPKATVAISTKTSSVNVNLAANLNPSAQTLDTANAVLPAKIEQQQKTTTQLVTASGQKNTGSTATGSVTLSACETSLSLPDSVPAGTGLSVNGLTFITTDVTKFKHSGTNNGSCFQYDATADTPISAQSAGAKYNVSNVSFTVAGRTDVSGSGSASGGTDNIIHIVAQADIDSAKQKLASADETAVKTALEQSLQQDGKYPLAVTFNASAPVITTSNNVGDTADSVTVTQAITYTMYGVNRNDLESLIKAKIADQIDTHGQSIVDNGLTKSTVTVEGSNNGVVQISLQTTAVVGPNIVPNDIKKQVAGKKAGDVKSYVNSLPDVTQVDVRLSPFWVSSVPSNTGKITVTVSGTNQT